VSATPADLGRLDGPVLLFGGPYSNLQATAAVLDAARNHDIPPARTICTGDVVAYGADPQATVDLVRAAGIHVVMGNCEESLGAEAEDCGCGFAEGSACAVASARWYAHAAAGLSADARRWMAGLPRRLDFNLADRRFAVVHGGVRQINRFVFASTPAAEKLTELAFAGTDAIVAGHCGLPFSQVLDGRLWHNAGVVGMPANDGTPRAWYSLLEATAGGIRIGHHALDYDHAAAARRMRACDLPAGYADALETGLWPSLDVLPPAERTATGRALEATTHHWPSTHALRRVS